MDLVSAGVYKVIKTNILLVIYKGLLFYYPKGVVQTFYTITMHF